MERQRARAELDRQDILRTGGAQTGRKETDEGESQGDAMNSFHIKMSGGNRVRLRERGS
ncbi:MAG: hypothetical protein PSV13_03495 [Lacunisphaera sp.]|nr:hypothetical protein [Lacunisphaera sp.]